MLRSRTSEPAELLTLVAIFDEVPDRGSEPAIVARRHKERCSIPHLAMRRDVGEDERASGLGCFERRQPERFIERGRRVDRARAQQATHARCAERAERLYVREL